MRVFFNKQVFSCLFSFLLINFGSGCILPNPAYDPPGGAGAFICGDGMIDEGEACDDGNQNNGDGCSDQCQFETSLNCGDGNLDIDQGETCDDGNQNSGDGCDETCHIEGAGTCGLGNPRECGMHIWSFSVGNAEGSEKVQSIATDSQANIYVSGSVQSGIINFNPSIPDDPFNQNVNQDAFLAKYSPEGALIWLKTFPDQYAENYVVIDSQDSVYFLGGFTSEPINLGGDDLISAGDYDVVLAKFDSDGNHLWSQSIGGDNIDVAQGVSLSPEGNIVIAGIFNSSSLSMGGQAINQGGAPGDWDTFIAVFNGSGELQWKHSVVDTIRHRDEEHNILHINHQGEIFILFSSMSGSIDLGNGLVLAVDPYEDAVLAKFDSQGAAQWTHVIESDGFNQTGAYCMASDIQGNIWVAGTIFGDPVNLGGELLETNGEGIYYVAFSREDGSHLTSQSFPRLDVNGSGYVFSLHFDKLGNMWLAGSFSGKFNLGLGDLISNSSQDYEFYIAKFDPQQKLLWSQDYASGASSFHRGEIHLTTDSMAYPILAGAFDETVNLGGDTLVSQDDEDFFLAKFLP
ncbi:MAG: DUF4215 domain-containing protein [Deltaproteobacteria bacterium]|nr:DUF4215 domain-containing protein [Deltaproteobacteria bacterium]